MTKTAKSELEKEQEAGLKDEVSESKEKAENADNSEVSEDKEVEIETKDLSAELQKKLEQKENKYNNLKRKQRELLNELREKSDESQETENKKGGIFIAFGCLAIFAGYYCYKKLMNPQKSDKKEADSQDSGISVSEKAEKSSEDSFSNEVLNFLTKKD